MRREGNQLLPNTTFFKIKQSKVQMTNLQQYLLPDETVPEEVKICDFRLVHDGLLGKLQNEEYKKSINQLHYNDSVYIYIYRLWLRNFKMSQILPKFAEIHPYVCNAVGAITAYTNNVGTESNETYVTYRINKVFQSNITHFINNLLKSQCPKQLFVCLYTRLWIQKRWKRVTLGHAMFLLLRKTEELIQTMTKQCS